MFFENLARSIIYILLCKTYSTLQSLPQQISGSPAPSPLPGNTIQFNGLYIPIHLLPWTKQHTLSQANFNFKKQGAEFPWNLLRFTIRSRLKIWMMCFLTNRGGRFFFCGKQKTHPKRRRANISLHDGCMIHDPLQLMVQNPAPPPGMYIYLVDNRYWDNLPTSLNLVSFSDFCWPSTVHPGRLTWNLKMMVWKMIFLFNWVIFRFHVNLPGCIESTWRLLLPNLNLREAIISVQGNMRSAWEEVPFPRWGVGRISPWKTQTGSQADLGK